MSGWSSAVRLKPRDDRSAIRLDVRMKGSLRQLGSSSFDVDVIDLSATGCRIDTSCSLKDGASVWLKFPRLAPLETRVMWRDGYRYGCAFVNPLHMAVFDHICRRYRAR